MSEHPMREKLEAALHQLKSEQWDKEHQVSCLEEQLHICESRLSELKDEIAYTEGELHHMRLLSEVAS